MGELGREAGQRVVGEAKPGQFGEPGDFLRQVFQAVVIEVESGKSGEQADLRREVAQRSVGDVEAGEFGELADLRREMDERVVGEVEAGQIGELGEFGRQGFQPVVGEIQLRQRGQLGDPRREASQSESAQVEHAAATADAVANAFYGLVDRLLLRWFAFRLLHFLKYWKPTWDWQARRSGGFSWGNFPAPDLQLETDFELDFSSLSRAVSTHVYCVF